jgi:MSHA biogenesis protein MshK
MTRIATAILLVALALNVERAHALEDPTRPPRAERIAAPATHSAEPLLILQSIIRSPNGNAAIISGRLVPVGGRIGDARLVRVTEDEAVIQIGGAEKRLALYPAARKRFGDLPR